ncbi:DUF899 domain-containing protein [Kribbella sp. NBC_01484]|uniref:DUF899 family protein n=1 Tax=Kribbella sp. NBC_01484 TaxID=2903579 RepID=UPI002E327078|nr:DUF899 family protein [Kribbella sp. NBC_01484]
MNNTHRARVVTPAEREAARLRLLAKEQELTRARDALAAQRRRMPWLKVDWEDSPDGYPQVPRYSWLKRHDEYGPTGRAAQSATTESADHAHHD